MGCGRGADMVLARRLLGAVLALVCVSSSAVARLQSTDLGLVINQADPYSVAVGEHYIQRRHIPSGQVLRVVLPLRPTLTESEFKVLDAQIKAAMGPQVLALALAWTQPYAVECNSITSALGLGYQPQMCTNTCAAGRPSAFFNATAQTSWAQAGLRPSMLLAGRSVASGKALIDRGVASDRQLGRLGGAPAQVVWVSTTDTARNVRAPLYGPAGTLRGGMTRVLRFRGDAVAPQRNVVLWQTGAAQVPYAAQIGWLDGALADHLTSFGGRLLDSQGQMSALDWLEAGATASYGTVSEPCNHPQKFPHPQVLLGAYLRGNTALEAYWRSVAWPTQGVFVGEPLAAPYAR